MGDVSYMKKVYVTPLLAKEWLKKNPNNRKINKQRVMVYAKEMKEHKWEFFSDPITIGVDGSLKNGQHRLMAVIASGETVGFWVNYDSKCSVFDRGKTRSLKDVMTMRGDKNANGNMISIARFHYSSLGSTYTSDSEIIKFIYRNEENMRKAIAISYVGGGGVVRGTTIMKTAPCQYALLVLLHAGIQEDTLRSFAQVVNSGYANSPLDSAAITLRNQLLEIKHKGLSVRKHVLSLCLESAKTFAERKYRKRRFKGEQFPYLDDFVTDDVVQKYRDEAIEEMASTN